jgi:hypothetical protein
MLDIYSIPDKTECKNTTSHKFKQDLFDFFKSKQLNTCLEIGTNHGWTTKILSKLFNEVHTIDLYKDNISEAKRNNTDSENIFYYTGDAYDRNMYVNMPMMDVAFIDCIHTYENVLFDINTCIQRMDDTKGMYFIFDDYGHPISTGIQRAILQSIEEGLKFETYIGMGAGYQFNSKTTLIDNEGIILSYGK